MNWPGIVQTLIFIIALSYLLLGFDDLVWDIVTMLHKWIKKPKSRFNIQDLDSIPPKLLAVAIAAWREDNIITDVVENILASVLYPKSMYHLFVGVYPNDLATYDAVSKLASKYGNVHLVVNCRNGPTTKAQNINYIISHIKSYEEIHNCRFAGLTIHDAEDIVHPYEFMATSYLYEKYDALQFPVIPLQEMPTLTNFFRNLTSGTYADEFAENHFTTMVRRDAVNAFVPSAGTGLALSHKVLDYHKNSALLSEDSLTEDYKLSLNLRKAGVSLHYVLEKTPRPHTRGVLKHDYIATRSRFPTTFHAAVRQKTRWTLGITMQSISLKDIFKSELSFVERYSVYKDLKAKVANLLTLPGYPVFIFFVLSKIFPIGVMPPTGMPWYMGLLLTGMTIEHQLFRMRAIINIYGWRSAIVACFCPPILSIRLVWGGVINMVATLRAWRQFLSNPITRPDASRNITAPRVAQKPRIIAWAKTDHDFIAKDVLKRFRCGLGDVLIAKGIISAARMRAASLKPKTRVALRKAHLVEGLSVRCLSDDGVVSESQLLSALSAIKHIPYLKIQNTDVIDFSYIPHIFDPALLHELFTVPFFKTNTDYVFGFCQKSSCDAQTILRETYDISIKAIFASEALIKEALNKISESTFPGVVTDTSIMYRLFKKGMIDCEQLIIVINYMSALHISEGEVLDLMGLDQREGYARDKLIVSRTAGLERQLLAVGIFE